MNNLHISNILGLNNDEKKEKFGSELFKNSNSPTVKSEIDDIFKNLKNKRESKLRLYNDELLICLKKIKMNSVNTDMFLFHTVRDKIIGHNEYDAEECMEYVKCELIKNKIDVHVVNKTTLFISWKFSELYK